MATTLTRKPHSGIRKLAPEHVSLVLGADKIKARQEVAAAEAAQEAAARQAHQEQERAE
jgi:hypothetical protein